MKSIQIVLLISVLAASTVFLSEIVSASHIIDGDALLAYMEGNSTPPYRTWNGTNLSLEGYALEMGNNNPDWVEIATSLVNFTAVMVILDSSDDVNAQVWNGSWSNNLEMTDNSRVDDHSFDVAYENYTGRALVVYNNRQTTPKYRIWDGASWSSENTALDVGSEPEDMRLRSNPKRNEMVLITREADRSIDLQVWNGSSWTNITQVSNNSALDDTPIAVAFERVSGDALAVWGDTNDDTPNYATWNGTNWTSPANASSIGEATRDVLYIELTSHPYTDEITMVTIDDASDTNVQVWNGTGWHNQTEVTTTGCANRFCADVVYESKNNRSIVVYSDNTNTPKYRIWNGSAWSAEASIANIGSEPSNIDLASHPNKDQISLLIEDGNGDAHFFVWNTTTWTDNGAIGTGLTSVARKDVAAVYVVPPGNPPVIDNITASPNPIKGGSMITMAVNGTDLNNGTISLFCSTASTPNSSNTNCTGGTLTDSTHPYNLTCTFTAPSDDTTHTEFCRFYDQIEFSDAANITYTTDSTVPSTSVNNVSGDTAATYIDNINDGFTNITVNGEANMQCRFHTSDVVYSSVPSANECTIQGALGICPAQPSQGTPDFYVSCRDSLANEQSTSQNLDITDLLVDWTAPTTSDNSVTDIKVPTYTVTITEADNVDSDSDTKFCTDTANSCTPGTSIDSGGQVSYNSSNRGRNFLRYNSTDDAGNSQTVQSKTININRLPVFTSASDDATTIRGGLNITVTTHSNETDSDLGQTLRLYVCNATGANSSGCTTTGATLCSNSSVSINTSCSFASETDDAVHSWFAYLFDDSTEGASNNPQSGTYTTDTTAPTITILDPANSTFTQTSVTAQISLSENGHTGLYSLDGAANASMTKVSDTLFSATLSSLADLQTHNITFYANDSVGNMRNSSIRFFTIDTTSTDNSGPSIVVLSPRNNSFHSSAILLNISLSENGRDAWYNLDIAASNSSMTNISTTLWNATITPSESQHNITFYASDASSNNNTGNSSVIFFTYDVTAPRFSLANRTPFTVGDNSSVTCHSSWTDNIGFSLGIVQENATGTPTNHTVSLSGASGDVNYTIPQSSLKPVPVRCIFIVNDTTGNVNSTSMDFNVSDFTTPNITNITNTPTLVTDLDVNSSINVSANVTDNFNITTIVLQYKQANASSFTNATMTNTTRDLYNASFTPNVENNWTFRIVAVDYAGNQNISVEKDLSVAQDRSFNANTTISAIKSIVQTDSRIIGLGNITVNNTGDFDLNFTVNTSQTWITFNGTTNSSVIFVVNQKGNTTTFNVTANATGFAVGNFNFTIQTFGFTLNPTLVSTETISGQVAIQNVAGPLLTVTITTFDSSVNKGDNGVEYSAKVENLGTADATGTWLAWVLPSEFTVTTGSQNKSIGNLPIGASATNTVTVDVSSSADDKNTSVSANASSAQGSVDNKTKTVTIGTPTTVTQTVSTTTATSGGGGGGGGGAAAGRILSGEEVISSSETFNLVRGTTNSFPVTVNNIFQNTILKDVSVKVEGIFPQFVKVTPGLIGEIRFNESKTFTVEITSPEYFELGTRKLDVVIVGKIVGTTVEKGFTERRVVTLVVHAVGREEVGGVLKLAVEDVEKMANVGFPTGKVSKLLDEAITALEENNFGRANDLIEEIRREKETAFEAYALIQEVRDKARSYVSITGAFLGVQRKFSETEEITNLALAAFEREDFRAALERAKSAKLTLALEGKDFSAVFFLVDYWWAILIGIAAASVSGTFGYRFYLSATISQKISGLGREEEGIRKLMKEAQRGHFQEKMIGPGSFQKMMKGYQERLAKITQLRLKMRHRRVRLMSPQNLLQDLERESREITNILKRLQREYFEKREIGKPAYDEQVKVYNRRLSEIEEERLVLETRTSHGGGEE